MLTPADESTSWYLMRHYSKDTMTNASILNLISVEDNAEHKVENKSLSIVGIPIIVSIY